MQVRQCRAHTQDHHGEFQIGDARAHEASDQDRDHRYRDNPEVRHAQNAKRRAASPLPKGRGNRSTSSYYPDAAGVVRFVPVALLGSNSQAAVGGPKAPSVAGPTRLLSPRTSDEPGAPGLAPACGSGSPRAGLHTVLAGSVVVYSPCRFLPAPRQRVRATYVVAEPGAL